MKNLNIQILKNYFTTGWRFLWKTRTFSTLNMFGLAIGIAAASMAYLLRSEIIFGLPITQSWSFRTAFLVEYTADPGSDEVNNTLTRTTVGLDYKF